MVSETLKMIRMLRDGEVDPASERGQKIMSEAIVSNPVQALKFLSFVPHGNLISAMRLGGFDTVEIGHLIFNDPKKRLDFIKMNRPETGPNDRANKSFSDIFTPDGSRVQSAAPARRTATPGSELAVLSPIALILDSIDDLEAEALDTVDTIKRAGMFGGPVAGHEAEMDMRPEDVFLNPFPDRPRPH